MLYPRKPALTVAMAVIVIAAADDVIVVADDVEASRCMLIPPGADK